MLIILELISHNMQCIILKPHGQFMYLKQKIWISLLILFSTSTLKMKYALVIPRFNMT